MKINTRIYSKNKNRMYYINDKEYINKTECIEMLCTNLKDINNIMIYEGDMLYYDEEYTGKYGYAIVEFGDYLEENNEHYGFYLKFKDGVTVGIDSEVMDEYEIIGNIYENKELL